MALTSFKYGDDSFFVQQKAICTENMLYCVYLNSERVFEASFPNWAAVGLVTKNKTHILFANSTAACWTAGIGVVHLELNYDLVDVLIQKNSVILFSELSIEEFTLSGQLKNRIDLRGLATRFRLVGDRINVRFDDNMEIDLAWPIEE